MTMRWVAQWRARLNSDGMAGLSLKVIGSGEPDEFLLPIRTIREMARQFTDMSKRLPGVADVEWQPSRYRAAARSPGEVALQIGLAPAHRKIILVMRSPEGMDMELDMSLSDARELMARLADSIATLETEPSAAKH